MTGMALIPPPPAPPPPAGLPLALEPLAAPLGRKANRCRSVLAWRVVAAAAEVEKVVEVERDAGLAGAAREVAEEEAVDRRLRAARGESERVSALLALQRVRAKEEQRKE